MKVWLRLLLLRTPLVGEALTSVVTARRQGRRHCHHEEMQGSKDGGLQHAATEDMDIPVLMLGSLQGANCWY
jgi:hypothetical protein